MKMFKVHATVEKEIDFYIQADDEPQLRAIIDGDEFKVHASGIIAHNPDNVGITIERIREVKWNEQASGTETS